MNQHNIVITREEWGEMRKLLEENIKKDFLKYQKINEFIACTMRYLLNKLKINYFS